MGLDPFFRHPFRTSKGGGTKCTTCEVVEECNDATKCVFPLICVSASIPGCEGATLINANPFTGAVQYDCTNHRFDLSLDCNGYEVDLYLTYEAVSGTPSAVLRSTWLGLEESIPFTETENARCPTFYFGSVATSPYPAVALGPQMCIDSAPDDCTAGRCVPRVLCLDMYTVDRPDEAYHTELEWYLNDYVQINDACCCNANTFPTMLIARVANYSEGCTCMAPQKQGTAYYTAQQSGWSLVDAGAILHLQHSVAGGGDAFVTGYPYLTEGVDVWVSEGTMGDLVKLCPNEDMTVTEDTREIYGRMMVWCDPADGKFKAAFETVDITGSNEYGNTDYTTPFNLENPFSSVYLMNAELLACNPFSIKMTGIVEESNCQSNQSVDGTGILEVYVAEFQGWVGPHPIYPEYNITFYSERVNTASPVQTLATDCYPKLHIQGGARETYKDRMDYFSIDAIWPSHVWEGCTFRINELVAYTSVSIIEVYPRSCTGCQAVVVEDPYIIQTCCCPGPVPAVLYLSAVQEQYCPCADDVLIELIYDRDEEAWIGTGPFGSSGCPCTLTVRLDCQSLISDCIFSLRITPSIGAETFIQYNPIEDAVFQCDPFLWITRSTSNDSCCNPSFPASQFHWVISQ